MGQKEFGVPKFGPHICRHIYMTHMMGKGLSKEKLEKIATMMQTSLKILLHVYVRSNESINEKIIINEIANYTNKTKQNKTKI